MVLGVGSQKYVPNLNEVEGNLISKDDGILAWEILEVLDDHQENLNNITKIRIL